MKKILTAILALAVFAPAFAGVIKESQAKREVDDAIQALAAMDARQELSTFLPQKEAYTARTYCNKARNFLSDSEYDKASFYAVLSTNYSKISVHKGLLAKAEKDKLESALAGAIVPRLKSVGFKRKGNTGTFTGVFDMKAIYALKRGRPKVDEIPPIGEEMVGRVAELAGVLNAQKEIKILFQARGINEDLAAKYADSIKTALIEKGIEAARIEVQTKKSNKDGVEITLDNVNVK
ncbi:MAG: hypothetical protein U1F27_07645 [Turneriella sp.]